MDSTVQNIKHLADMLDASAENVEMRLFEIHQAIDQHLFGGDGNLTYIGKILTLKENGKI